MGAVNLSDGDLERAGLTLSPVVGYGPLYRLDDDRLAALLRERDEMSKALAATASLLYDVWRCNTDSERSVYGGHVARAVDAYAKHPSHVLAALATQEGPTDA